LNAPSPHEPEWAPDRTVIELLIAELRLPAALVAEIYESMLPTDADFTDAALRLKHVTHEKVAEAVARVRAQIASEQAGVVENVIKRVSSNSQVVVRYGDSVKPGPQLILAHDPYNPRSERIRALRTELLLLNGSARGANIVPVLSPCSTEGRSQLAAELAVSFAQLGRRTLLVDADMRKSHQHVLFGSKNERGLSNAIAKGDRPDFHPVIGTPLMHVLTSGPMPPNPLELLSDGRFAKLLSQWRNTYEFIVLDTPPVSSYADALAVAALAARALLVSRTKHTSFKDTRDMLRRLETTHSKILGAVLNSF